jgi:hypothetical protein
MKDIREYYSRPAFDAIALSSVYSKWDREAPSRFSSLQKQIADWDRSYRSRTKLLKFLDELKKAGAEALLTGLLAEGLARDGGYMRQVVVRGRQHRLVLLHKAIAGLTKSVAALRQVGELDEDTSCRLISTAEREQRKVLTDERRRLADQLMAQVDLLKQECKSVKKFLSTQRLGASPKRWNIECLLQIRSWLAPKVKLTLSFNDLGGLMDAAYLAWAEEDTTTDPKSLKRAFKRFHHRNPDLIKFFE